MKKNNIFVIAAILLLATVGFSQTKTPDGSNKQVELTTVISYCNLEISRAKKLANLSFNVLYRFEVAENGESVKIRKLRDDYVGEETVKRCVSTWKIEGVPPKTLFFVYFYWSHKKGWFRQTINSTRFSQVMEMEDVGIVKLVDIGRK